jgi:hypothetical protein
MTTEHKLQLAVALIFMALIGWAMWQVESEE